MGREGGCSRTWEVAGTPAAASLQALEVASDPLGGLWGSAVPARCPRPAAEVTAGICVAPREPGPALRQEPGLGTPSGWQSQAEAAGSLLPGPCGRDSLTGTAVPGLSPSLSPGPGCRCRELRGVRVAAVPVPRLRPPAPAPGVPTPGSPGKQPEERRSPRAVPRLSPAPRWEAEEPGGPQVTAARAPRP